MTLTNTLTIDQINSEVQKEVVGFKKLTSEDVIKYVIQTCKQRNHQKEYNKKKNQTISTLNRLMRERGVNIEELIESIEE